MLVLVLGLALVLGLPASSQSRHAPIAPCGHARTGWHGTVTLTSTLTLTLTVRVKVLVLMLGFVFVFVLGLGLGLVLRSGLALGLEG